MGLHNESKINYLLQKWPPGTPAQTAWLRELGYSDQLINKYKKSNWLVCLSEPELIKGQMTRSLT